MIYLIALVLTGIFIATTQNYFCKNLLRTKSDNFAYSIIVYIVALISTFIINGCEIKTFSGFTLIDGIIYGLMLTTELYCTLEALKIGPLSLTTLFIVASSIIPIIPSWIIWKDPITWQQVIGIIVMFGAAALVLDAGNKTENKEYNLVCISAGELLRGVDPNTELGKKIREIQAKRELVDNSITNKLDM